MTSGQTENQAAGELQSRPRLFYFNGGFFTQKQVRRIIELSGFDLKLGKPGADDLIAVWGRSPTSGRGTTVADKTGAGVVHVEDALLRSIHPGRMGEPPAGLTIDHMCPYFDSSKPSDLEMLLAKHPLDDSALMTRARDAIEAIKDANLSKYNDFDPDLRPPSPGYVLVLDQSRGDASISYGGGSIGHFREMLVFAQEEHPGARVIIKSHPDTQAGHRAGHFGPEHLSENVSLLTEPISPHALLEGAIAVYTVSSGMGFEAILAGHKPVVFGQPFYAGWGLTDDRQPIDRRQRRLTRAQLFAGAMMLYPKWYDPYRDQLCEIEDVIHGLAARTRAYREDRQGYDTFAMRLWKRPAIRNFFGRDVRFTKTATDNRPALVWAGKADQAPGDAIRVEDGFLRSRGLGADLIAPLSLVADGTGIYYDPRGPSDLETLIASSPGLPDHALKYAEQLRRKIIAAGVSKYNLKREEPDIDAGGKQILLVPGQVEDDASVLLGCDEVATNEALLTRTRRDFPGAFIIYKPHPDVEAGLRDGAIEATDADLIAKHSDPISLLGKADRVSTMTSLMGFEALLREIPVTCYGAPFYAGWGLSDDRGAVPARRNVAVSLAQLVHAALITYPRYFDPVTHLAAPPEIIIERLASGKFPKPSPANRALAKLQGALASYAYLWRR